MSRQQPYENSVEKLIKSQTGIGRFTMAVSAPTRKEVAIVRNQAKRRCMLIGHHVLLLDGLRTVLEHEFEILAVAPASDTVLPAAAMFSPDAVVIDLDAGDTAFVIGTRLSEDHPEVGMTYLTSDPMRVACAVSKTCSASDLLRLVRFGIHGSEASNGERRSSPEVSQGELTGTATLSGRQREVLSLLVHGQSMKQVARQLGLAPRTVAFHKYRAMAANGLRNNADLVSFALLHGILQDQTS
jgi:DNA-binding NarL/FixJ family response regulator